MASTSTVAVLVCDLVGSTARHARLGEDAADRFRAIFFSTMRTAVERNDGEVVKNLGDGLLVVFRRSTVAALDCAHDLHEAMVALDHDDPVQLRVGVSAGEVAEEDGDWFGMPVIEASRLCAVAAPASTATTGVVRNLAGSRGVHHFTLLGQRELKGIPYSVEVFSVQRDDPTVHSAAPAIERKRSHRRTLLAGVAAAVAAVVVVVTTVVILRDDEAPVSKGPSESSVTTGPSASSVSTTVAAPTPVQAKIAAPTTYTPVLSARDCATDEFESTVDESGARSYPRAQCWTLTVPEDRANPERTIELHGYSVPALTNPETAPTIIDLGPANSLLNPISKVANLVVVPARGMGLSTPAITCPEEYEVVVAGLALPSGDPGIATQRLDAVRACRARLVAEGFNLASYNFEAEIGDVTDYLIAAGVDSAFLTATSDDAPAVFVAADRFPGTFRGVLLENPIDPGSMGLADRTRDLAEAFNRFIKLCLADPICGAAYPDMGSAREALIEFANAAPQLGTVTASGYPGRWIGLRSVDQPMEVLLDGARITRAQAVALFDPATYGVIPLSQSSVPGTFEDAARQLAARNELGESEVGAASHSFRCAVLPPNTDHEVSNRALPSFAAIDDTALPERCKVWDVPLLGREFFAPTTGSTPTLIAVGELADLPAAQWAENLQRSRPNTTVISFSTLGRFVGPFAPACYPTLIQTFVLDPSAALDVATCEAQSPPITFVTGS